MSNQATSVDPASPPARKRRPPRTLYRGDPGMWSWVLHRISGATIFFFLFVHVLDAAMLRVSPQTYDAVVGDYKTPLVGLMEYGLIAAVLFHGLNGIRIILIDFWSQGPAVSAADVLDRRHRLPAADGSGRRGDRHSHLGAPAMSSPDLQLAAPARRHRSGNASTTAPPAWTIPAHRAGAPAFPTSRSSPGCSCAFPGWRCSSWRSGTCSSC